MNGSDSGQATGTTGQPQQSTEQFTYESQTAANERDLDERVRLIRELQNAGTKFTEKDIQFITKDKTGQIVWLETGNQTSGLNHILARHAEDYGRSMGISQDQIAETLHKVFRDGIVCYSRTKHGAHGGFERLYRSEGKYYLLSGIGSNGYIVTAYPINAKTARKLIERYGAHD